MALSMVWQLALIGACGEALDKYRRHESIASALPGASADDVEWLRHRCYGDGIGYEIGRAHV